MYDELFTLCTLILKEASGAWILYQMLHSDMFRLFFCCLEAIYFGWVPYGTMPVLEAHSCHKDLWMITMSHRNPLTLASLIIVSTVFSSYTT